MRSVLILARVQAGMGRFTQLKLRGYVADVAVWRSKRPCSYGGNQQASSRSRGDRSGRAEWLRRPGAHEMGSLEPKFKVRARGN